MTNQEKYEKNEKVRRVRIEDPTDYGSKNGVYIVNGCARLNDGNFVDEFLIMSLGNTNIFCGSFPTNVKNVEELNKNQISAVLNLQTQEEQE